MDICNSQGQSGLAKSPPTKPKSSQIFEGYSNISPVKTKVGTTLEKRRVSLKYGTQKQLFGDKSSSKDGQHPL